MDYTAKTMFCYYATIKFEIGNGKCSGINPLAVVCRVASAQTGLRPSCTTVDLAFLVIGIFFLTLVSQKSMCLTPVV